MGADYNIGIGNTIKDQVAVFMNICNDIKNSNGTITDKKYLCTWNDIEKKLVAKKVPEYTRRVLKYRWINLKEWAKYLKSNPDARKQTTPIFQQYMECVEEMKVLFGESLEETPQERGHAGPDSKESSRSGKKVDTDPIYTFRVQYTTKDLVAVFMNICNDIKNSNGTKTDGKHLYSWNEIENKLVEKKVPEYTRRGFEVQWIVMKEKYKIWLHLVDAACTSNESNPTFVYSKLTAVWWGNYLKSNPDARQFRYTPLQCVEEMKVLFGEVLEEETLQVSEDTGSDSKENDNAGSDLASGKNVDIDPNYTIRVEYATTKDQVAFFMNVRNDIENSDGTKPDGKHLYSWNEIEKKLVEKKVPKCTRCEMKDEWIALKKKYKIWLHLVDDARTSNESNPTFEHKILSAVWWGKYLKSNPDARQFRFIPLQCVEEMKVLFGEFLEEESDNAGLDSSSRKKVDTDPNNHPIPEEASLPKDDPPTENCSMNFADQLERVSSDTDPDTHPTPEEASLPKNASPMEKYLMDFDDYVKRVSSNTNPDTYPTPQESSSPKEASPTENCLMDLGDQQKGVWSNTNPDTHPTPEDASLPQDASPTKKRSMDFDDQLERILKTVKRPYETSLEECNKVLDGMKTLKMDNPLYIAACTIFCESQTHREQWMMLSKKTEEVRISWLLMIAKKLQLV